MDRVAIVTDDFFPRTCGVGDYALRVAEELLRRGRAAAVFAGKEVERHPEVPAVPAFGIAEARGSRKKVAAVERALAEFRPRLVSIQYTPLAFARSRFGSLGAARLAARLHRAGVRVQVVLHELASPWPRARHVGARLGRIFGPALRPDRAAVAVGHRIELAALIASADSVVVTTEPRREEVTALARRLGICPRIDVVAVGSNVLPIPAGPPASEGHGDAGPFRLGTFGTLDAGKRLDVVLGAFARVAHELPRAELVLIGDADRYPGRRAQLEARIRRHPARERIRVTGKLSLGAVAEEISRLSVYLFPMYTGATTRSGTLPLPLGAGVPVVAMRGGDAEPFEAAGAVLFAERLEPSAFAEAVFRLAKDRALAARITRAGRDLYEEQLSWPRIVDALLLAAG